MVGGAPPGVEADRVRVYVVGWGAGLWGWWGFVPQPTGKNSASTSNRDSTTLEIVLIPSIMSCCAVINGWLVVDVLFGAVCGCDLAEMREGLGAARLVAPRRRWR